MKTRTIGLISLFIFAVALTICVSPTASSAQHKMRMQQEPAKVIFPEGKDVVEIPFTFERNKILIPVRVNGSEPMTFILDSGAPIAVVRDPDFGSKVDLNIVGQAHVGGAGEDETQSVPIAGDVTLQLGDIEITGSSMAVGVGNRLPDTGWDGVIGGPLFTNLVIDFDFTNKILRFYSPDNYTYSGNGSVLPLTISHGSFAHVNTEISIDGGPATPAKFVIDTGAGNALSVNTDDALGAPEKTIDGIIGWGANGVIRGRTGRVASLKLGDYVLNDLVASFPDASGMHAIRAAGVSKDETGILGAKVLKRFHVIFDYPNSRMILEPNGAFETPFTFNNTGLMALPWAPGASSIEVVYVLESSPAQTVGVEIGDHITAINGRPVAEFGVDALEDVFKQAPGSKITLTIHRETEEFEMKLVLEELI